MCDVDVVAFSRSHCRFVRYICENAHRPITRQLLCTCGHVETACCETRMMKKAGLSVKADLSDVYREKEKYCNIISPVNAFLYNH